jgi:beta-lactam-binding protein with PASTA domain
MTVTCRLVCGAAALLVVCHAFPASFGAEASGAASVAAAAKTVPNVVGQRPEVARQMLRLAGFEFAQGVYYIAPQNWRDDIRSGVVGMQSPQALLRAPDKVVVVCWCLRSAEEGRKVVPVPDVRGQSAQAAEEKLREVGLGVVTSPSGGSKSPDAKALVTAHYPPADSRVYEGTHVVIRTRFPIASNRSSSGPNMIGD